jgi:NAD-reducing hydrogenase small subunit
MAKPKISTDWLAGCSGCHMSLLDIDERIIKVAELADIRSTPITDLKQPDASGVDVGILEGGVNNTANEEVVHRMRSRCKVLVALGDCAVFGGVPAMRNFFTIEEALRRAYIETESTDSEGKIPNDPDRKSVV